MGVHNSDSIAQRIEQQERIAIAFLVLAWVFIALRIWTRTYVIANFGWDDSSMILAGMLFTVYCASVLFINANGGGTHVTSVAQMVMLTKWVVVGEATYIVTIMTLKISLGIFFARIVIKAWQLTVIYIAVGVNIVSSIASFIYVLLRCGPNLDAYVYKQLANNCTPRGLDRFFAYQQAAFSTLTDIVFATLPIFILWNTCMNKQSKISVGLILSMAALGCICSIIRFQYVDGLTQIEDFFWNAVNIALWSAIEPGAGIIAGCLATLRPFLKGLVIQARSIRSLTSQSTRQLSRSFRSNENSSNKNSITTSDSRQSNTKRLRIDKSTGGTAQSHQDFELKSDVNKLGESTDYILNRSEVLDRPWSAQSSRSLDFDQTDTRRTQNRTVGDSQSADWSLSSEPPELPYNSVKV